MEKRILAKIVNTITIILLLVSGFILCSATSFATPAPDEDANFIALQQTPSLQGTPMQIWKELLHLSTAQLTLLQRQVDDDSVESAWYQLAIISKQKGINTAQLASDVLAWREQNPTHPGNQLLPNTAALAQLQGVNTPRQIAILLPQTGSYANAGKEVREGFLKAYYVSQAQPSQQNIKFYDTSNTLNIPALYQQAVAEGADFVVGPLIKEDVQQLSLLSQINTPTLALNYSEDRPRANLYEFGLLPEDEAIQIADRAQEAGLRRALIIAPQTGWGRRMVAGFSKRWKLQGGAVKQTLFYTSRDRFNTDIAQLLKIDVRADKKLMQADNNKTTLSKQRRQDFDVILLFSQPQEARLIVPLLRFYYAGDVPVYASASVYAADASALKDPDLNGIIVCDLPTRLKETDTPLKRLYAVGQDAYLLTQSLQRLTTLQNFPLYGTTGALVISNNQVHRRLPCFKVTTG